VTDIIQRFLFEHAPLRGEIVHLEATWHAVLERHDYPPAVRALLGEMMAAAALLTATLKFGGTLIMQIQGKGPVKLLVVECTSDHHMRATAKWSQVPATGALLDLALEEDLKTVFIALTLNSDEEAVGRMLRHPASMVSLSDAGAHLTFFNDAGFGLHLLGHWVRELGVLSLAEAVRKRRLAHGAKA